MTTRSLDLGCGNRLSNPFHADEVLGVDIREDLGAQVSVADLVIQPIPFPDAHFDFVSAFDFLQFIPALVYAPMRRNAFVDLMNEVYRVLKPGGLFVSSTPAYPHAIAFRDPAHVNLITFETLRLYFDNRVRWASHYGFEGAFQFRLNEMREQHLFAVMEKVAVQAAPKIGIFLPVYNGAKYLSQTLDSALAQTFTDFELICINDCSTDSSLEILQDYARRDPRVRVVSTPENMGTAPKAMNFALPALRSEYFVYSSQDDLFSPDWLEKMYARAAETGADAVVPDLVFYHETQPEKNRALVGVRGDRSAVLTGREAAVLSLDWTIPGNALWRTSMVKRLRFEEFGMNSDEYSGRVFYLNCQKVVFSEGQFLYRQDNEAAITKKITYKTFDMPYTFFRLYQLLKQHDFQPEIANREGIKSIRTLVNLQQWLAVNRATMSEHEVKEAEARAQKVHQCLLDHKVYELLAQN